MFLKVPPVSRQHWCKLYLLTLGMILIRAPNWKWPHVCLREMKCHRNVLQLRTIQPVNFFSNGGTLHSGKTVLLVSGECSSSRQQKNVLKFTSTCLQGNTSSSQLVKSINERWVICMTLCYELWVDGIHQSL